MHLHQTLFNPTNPQISKEKFFQGIFWKFSRQFSLSFLYISLPKTHQKTFDSSFLSTITRQCSCSQSSSHWQNTLDLRFRGVVVAFQLKSILISFPSMFLLYLASQQVLWFFFFQHVSLLLPCFNALMLFAKPSWARINLNFVFVLRSTCVCAPCHAFAQIYMFMCSLPCLCLDLHVYVLFDMFLLRCVSLSALCPVHVSRSTC